jgi:hypothetical protein
VRLNDGKQPGGGFLLSSVPKMFAGKNAQYLQRRKVQGALVKAGS